MGQTTKRNEEPTNEDQTQDLKRFLENGAATSVEELEEFAGGTSVRATLAAPASVPFRVEQQELAGRIQEAEENQALLTVSVDRVEAPRDCLVHVFVNKPDADARTSLDDPHYAASFAFFCHTVAQRGNDFTCEIPGSDAVELRYRFNVTSVLERTGGSGTPQATFVVVPIEGRQPRTASVSVQSAELRLVKSVVNR
jgi:hypothetical protein